MVNEMKVLKYAYFWGKYYYSESSGILFRSMSRPSKSDVKGKSKQIYPFFEKLRHVDKTVFNWCTFSLIHMQYIIVIEYESLYLIIYEHHTQLMQSH